MSRTSRRAFLATIGGLAVGVLAACQPAPTPAPEPTRRPAATPGASSPKTAPASWRQPVAPGAERTVAAGLKARSQPKRGGELRIVQADGLASLDPIQAWGPTASAVYDSLFSWRPDAQGVWSIQPMLAKSWELGSDRLVVRLQEQVRFHDGSDLTAEVVAWNLTRMVRQPGSQARAYVPQLDQDRPAQVLDPLTVQLNLTRPSASILASLSDGLGDRQTAIVSRKAVEEQGEAWLQRNPVGTGPFKLASFAPGERLTLERNPAYWRMGADGKPLPYADKATLRVIPEPAKRLAEMEAGKADLIANVRGRDVEAARKIGHALYVESAFAGVRRQLFFNAARPPFQNSPKLRQAVEHAVDRAALAKTLGAGLGIPLPYELVPGSIGYDTAVPHYAYDPERAKRLLTETGLPLPMTVRLTTHNRETDRQQARLLGEMLERVGVKLELESVAPAAWTERVQSRSDFEMATRQSGVVMDPSLDLPITWAEDGHSAYHRGAVPGLHATLQQADAALDDRRRHQLLVDAQRLMHDAAWFGYLWFENGNFLVHKRIRGFPASRGSLREAAWWIDEGSG